MVALCCPLTLEHLCDLEGPKSSVWDAQSDVIETFGTMIGLDGLSAYYSLFSSFSIMVLIQLCCTNYIKFISIGMLQVH